MTDALHALAPDRSLAVMIDAENAELSMIGHILAQARRHGTVTVCRAYGDWNGALSVWTECLRSHMVELVRQPEPVRAKNSADRALIGDATKMLRSGEINGFCIVASDNDYAGMVAQIRNRGVFVLGIGSTDKPPSFRRKCSVFRYAERLPRPDRPAGSVYREVDVVVVTKIRGAVASSAPRGDGWVLLSEVGINLKKTDSHFKYHSHCQRDLQRLIESYPMEFETRSNMYARLRLPCGSSPPFTGSR